MPWTQIYNPLGNVLLSALVASLPIVVLLGLLAFFHVRAHIAALAGLGTSLLVAILVYGMPVPLAVASAVNGAAFGLFPIGWIVLCAIFLTTSRLRPASLRLSKKPLPASLMIGAFKLC